MTEEKIRVLQVRHMPLTLIAKIKLEATLVGQSMSKWIRDRLQEVINNKERKE